MKLIKGRKKWTIKGITNEQLKMLFHPHNIVGVPYPTAEMVQASNEIYEALEGPAYGGSDYHEGVVNAFRDFK